jgi:hypothetical protein
VSTERIHSLHWTSRDNLFGVYIEDS